MPRAKKKPNKAQRVANVGARARGKVYRKRSGSDVTRKTDSGYTYTRPTYKTMRKAEAAGKKASRKVARKQVKRGRPGLKGKARVRAVNKRVRKAGSYGKGDT